MRRVSPESLTTWMSATVLRSRWSVRFETNAISRPSGDQRGEESWAMPAVIWAGAFVPSAGTSQIAPTYPSRFGFAVFTAYATRAPSGEICASVRKRNSYRSSGERGRGDEDNAAYRAIHGPVRPARTYRDARRSAGDVLRPRRRVPPQHGRDAVRR